MAEITFILGGARSGKSAYALNEASLLQGEKAFIATAESLDMEMEERITRHKAERGPSWTTFEEPINIKEVLWNITPKYPVVLIDCLTLWVSNLLHKQLNTREEFEGLVKTFSNFPIHIYTLFPMRSVWASSPKMPLRGPIGTSSGF